ncbi:hypothetical protein YC2023_098858 [Brassica napus]
MNFVSGVYDSHLRNRYLAFQEKLWIIAQLLSGHIERWSLKCLASERMVEYLCGGRVAGDKDQSRSFEVRGGRRSDRE